jgi:hypothetical protein
LELYEAAPDEGANWGDTIGLDVKDKDIESDSDDEEGKPKKKDGSFSTLNSVI